MTLKGEKVRLRPVEREDLPRLHAIEQNIDLVTLADGYWNPSPLAAIEQNFARNIIDEERSWFAIEADGTLIGTCGLHHKNRREGTASVGIGIYDPEYVGQGYGRDALRLLLHWAFHNQNWRKIWLDTDSVNERAIRAYRAVGFVEEGRQRLQSYANGAYCDRVLMGILRSEWEERQPR